MNVGGSLSSGDLELLQFGHVAAGQNTAGERTQMGPWLEVVHAVVVVTLVQIWQCDHVGRWQFELTNGYHVDYVTDYHQSDVDQVTDLFVVVANGKHRNEEQGQLDFDCEDPRVR